MDTVATSSTTTESIRPAPVQPETVSATDAADDTLGLVESSKALWSDLHGLAYDYFELATLETQRAGENLASMLAYAVAVGVLVVSAWLGLLGVLVLWLRATGVHLSAAVLVAVILNLVMAFGLVIIIRRRSHQLRFPGMLAALNPARKKIDPVRPQ